jgi:hypothetical protein
MMLSARLAVAAILASAAAAHTTLPAGDPKVNWAGRTLAAAGGSVSFDWLGVTARVNVTGATYVSVTTTSTATHRGTRLKAYTSDQGFMLSPQVQVWVPPQHGPPGSNSSLLWTGAPSSRVITLENIVDPQYGTGITTVHSFETDGAFAALSPAAMLGGGPKGGTRRIEFIGDSITAATNVVRPEGMSNACGDGGYQSDWSQTYEGLLCHRFGASCSTIAVGGKCVMHECGGLQMPDYFPSLFFQDAPKPTYSFDAAEWAPDAMFIDLGTNDRRGIAKVDPNATGTGMQRFAEETLQFMLNATKFYKKPDIQFFLNAGPMENTTIVGTQSAIKMAVAKGLHATFVDMQTACVDANLHAWDDSDDCDGCAGHPGIQGHRGMYEAAWPVMTKVMGWKSWPYQYILPGAE